MVGFLRLHRQGGVRSLYEFDITHGQHPFSELSLGNDGSFYGTTVFGCSGGDGVIFRITAAGSLTVLHNFYGSIDKSDGADPYAPPIQALV
jgi:uncharacterized repeat protein (TIGR03803 family)